MITGRKECFHPVRDGLTADSSVADKGFCLGIVQEAFVGKGDEGLEQESEPVGRGAALDVQAVKIGTGLHFHAVGSQAVPEGGRLHTAGIVKGKHFRNIAAFPFPEVRNLGKAAVQLQGIVEGILPFNLLVGHADTVGKGPQGAARDGFFLLFAYSYPGGERLQTGCIGPVPGIVFFLG